MLALTLLLFVLELARQGMNAKTASALATLMMIAAALRIPTLPAGATAFFFAIILGGYVFGPRFGFLLGAGSLFVSAFAIGGFGPWMPFQMFVAGWVGMTAGWLGTPAAAALPAPIAGDGRSGGLRGRLGLPLRGGDEPVVLAGHGRPARASPGSRA